MISIAEDADISESSPRLTEEECLVLRFMTDLEDRGSEWPDLNRIAKGIGIVSGQVETILADLVKQGHVQDHPNVDLVTRYAITRSGRVRYFSQVEV